MSLIRLPSISANSASMIMFLYPKRRSRLAEKLRLDKSVFIIAGDCFGMDHYLRMGIGGEQIELLEGMELIDETLREIR